MDSLLARQSAQRRQSRRRQPFGRIPRRRRAQGGHLESDRDNPLHAALVQRSGETELQEIFETRHPHRRHDFGIEDWEPDRTEKLSEPEKKLDGYMHYHTLYLWRLKGN
jgi:hypothetical protein